VPGSGAELSILRTFFTGSQNRSNSSAPLRGRHGTDLPPSMVIAERLSDTRFSDQFWTEPFN